MDSSNRRMDIEYRGDLEEIARPRSNKQRAGSRPLPTSASNSASSSVQRFKSGASSLQSLELLKPHDIVDRDLDLELEELVSESSDDNVTCTEDMEDTARSSAMFNIAEPLPEKGSKHSKPESFADCSDDDEYLLSRQITLFASETDDNVSLCSEEEKDIIKEIRDEITKQVKEEMKGELALYQKAKERIQNESSQDENADLDALEPKLREAIVKMRKLDKILAKKIRKEKEVKRDRILLQRRLRAELDDLKCTKSITSEEKRNTDKFLALALPPSHNAEDESGNEQCLMIKAPPEGARDNKCLTVEAPCVELEQNAHPVTPVFQTQLPEDITASKHRDNQSANSATESSRNGDSMSGAASARSDSSRGESAAPSSTSARSRQSKAGSKKNKDFIKRNMELAADAANTIAMTDDEKKHLEDLLTDLDQLSDIPEETSSNASELNPFQVAVTTGEGFRPAGDEASRLEAIDERLKVLLPEEDYQSICTTPSSLSSASYKGSQLFTRTITRQTDIDIDQLGEQVLKETKEHRDVQQRLKAIEEELSQMSEAVDHEIASPTLTEAQLDNLLEQCARTMSRATAETTSLSQQSSARSGISSARSILYENPPKLSDDVLQELLSDARKSLHGSATPIRGIGSNESDDCVLESMSEDTIKELLVNSRTTSRMAAQSRAAMMPSPAPSAISNSMPHNVSSLEPTPRSHKEPRRPFLPEIDPKGTLSTQKLNNNTRLNNQDGVMSSRASSRLSAITVYNSLTDSVISDRSCDAGGVPGNPQIPHPPSESRKSSAGKSRTMSPAF